MINKTIPLVGEFTRVATSACPNEFGFVLERTKNELTIQYKNNIIGKYSIDKNSFERISISWGPEADTFSIDELISFIEEIFSKIDFTKIENNPPVSESPKRNVREWVENLDKDITQEPYDGVFDDETRRTN